MRIIYTALFYLVLPFAFMRLLWRSRKEPAYRRRWGERLGCYSFTLQKSIWVHAVSVGEVIAATPLIRQLQKDYPTFPILVTTMTPTGAARVKAAFGDEVLHVYLPYDVPFAVTRFLRAMKPVIGIIMETELWPNLLSICHQHKIPVCLTNARLSEKSMRGYKRIGHFTRQILRKLTMIAAHGKVDAERFIALGADKEKVHVTGNMKFDIQVQPELYDSAKKLRAELGNHRFIWIAASTHEGEEELILQAHRILLKSQPDALLILVPRHPDRFELVAKMANNLFKVVKRRTDGFPGREVAVYIGDTMGEMMLMYASSDVAFVGGSLIPRGGHNMLEPAVLSKPVITGPHVFNFAEISDLFVQGDAIYKVSDTDSLAKVLVELAADKPLRDAAGARAAAVVVNNRGALTAQVDLIRQIISKLPARMRGGVNDSAF